MKNKLETQEYYFKQLNLDFRIFIFQQFPPTLRFNPNCLISLIFETRNSGETIEIWGNPRIMFDSPPYFPTDSVGDKQLE